MPEPMNTGGIVRGPQDVILQPGEEVVAVPADHPAKWSAPVLECIAGYVQDEAAQCEQRLRVLDPFAGVGRQRLEDAIGLASAIEVVGVELQPEWGDEHTQEGDARDLPAEWSGRFDVIATSPCYGNRMADHHLAADPCKPCGGTGAAVREGPTSGAQACPTCKGHGLSWRNTYAHTLRRQGGDIVPGSAAVEQWGRGYRKLHAEVIMELMRVTREGGLLLVNMSNHVRDGQEQLVVEWWVNELLVRQCSIVEVRRVATRRQRNGANGELRVDGEVVIAMRTPIERRLL